jgi:hypothetical protein
MYEFIHIRNRVNVKKFVISNSGRKCVQLSKADFAVSEMEDHIYVCGK